MLNLPKPIQITLAALTGTSVVGLLGMIDYKLAIIAATGLIVLAALVCGYFILRKWWEKRQSSAMRGQMQQHSAGAPSGINDPAKRAQLDALKRNFDSGIEKFRTSGKDVYKLPWYLIVGEPGSGKTEAVRHCNVGFPPGLQDELQGVGGTINMNWWFTNRAVLLDTAGRLMFEEVKPGETSEWREFLQLLKRNRPNCPINGLFLVIPTDSLIRDSAAEITRKAGKIAQQMDLIQRTLDVRFPVFVLITKADLLVGFREFFESFEDPATQHQMFGWSNPEPRDAVFHPDQVERHLEVVVERIKKRRLGLLRDPIPQTSNGRRADEVDALYSLPQSLSLVAPRLRDYLQNVFVAGEWSAKPLFLRGIYFTSSMREGSALDQELANAIGVQLDDLPDGKAWERERAFFLRDLFIDKAFPEQGLVTRATNTKTLLKKRRLLVFGCIGLASALFLGLTVYGYRQFKSTIGDRAQYWKPAAADQGWAKTPEQPGPDTWTPMVRNEGQGKYTYEGDLHNFGPQKVNLLDYHQKLRELSGQEMKVALVFRPLAAAKKGFLAEQRTAQRVVFESSIIKPLILATRDRVTSGYFADSNGLDSSELTSRTDQLEEAIATLIRVEASAITAPKDASEVTTGIILPSLKFSAGKDLQKDTATSTLLQEIVAWTYFGGAGDKNRAVWPPAWLALGSSTLKANPPIDRALEARFQFIKNEQASAKAQINNLIAINISLQDFRKKEADLNKLASTADPEASELDPAIGIALENLAQSRLALDKAVALYSEGNDKISLKEAYEKIQQLISRQTTNAFLKIETAAKSVKPNPAHLLFQEVLDRLSKKKEEIALELQAELKSGQLDGTTLETVDRDLLQFFEPTGQRKYTARYETYKRAYDLGLADASGGTDVIPALSASRQRIAQARSSLARNKTEGLFEAPIAAEYSLNIAAIRQPTQIVRNYLDSVRSYFDGALTFPLVRERSKGADQDAVIGRARQVKTQIGALSAVELPPTCEIYKNKLANFAAGLELLKRQEVRAGSASVNVTSAPPNSRYVRGKGDWQNSFANPSLGAWSAGESINLQTRSNTDQVESFSLGAPSSFWGKGARSARGYSFSISFEEGSPKVSELPSKADILQPLL